MEYRQTHAQIHPDSKHTFKCPGRESISASPALEAHAITRKHDRSQKCMSYFFDDTESVDTFFCRFFFHNYNYNHKIVRFIVYVKHYLQIRSLFNITFIYTSSQNT